MRPRQAPARLRRFDFDAAPESYQFNTATIKELLSELNEERESDIKGTLVDRKSLGKTLAFIATVTGRSFKGSLQDLPMSTLKTIKLLYAENEKSDKHLFRLITSPRHGSKASLEYGTPGPAGLNQLNTDCLNNLLIELERGVAGERVKKVNISLLTPAKLLECIEIEDNEILSNICAQHGQDQGAFVEALSRLTNEISDYEPRMYESTRPLPEVIYTYLRTIGFAHFVSEHENVEKLAFDASPDIAVAEPINERLVTLTNCIKAELGRTVLPQERIVSVVGFSTVVEQFAEQFREITAKVTGLGMKNRNMSELAHYASKLLYAYRVHSHRTADRNALILSTTDCVAALCTIRHQQEAMTTYKPYWQGHPSVGENVLRHLNSDRSIKRLYDSDYIPHGVLQLLYLRFSAYHSALVGHLSVYKADRAFRRARLKKYLECMLSLDIDDMDEAVERLNGYCYRRSAS